MKDIRRLFGTSAEGLAASFLKKKGYSIVARQYRTKFGEVDLIAGHGDEIVFVEVKARHGHHFGFPEEAVTETKLQKIRAVAEEYLHRTKQEGCPYRIDVVAIEYKQSGPAIEHLIGVE